MPKVEVHENPCLVAIVVEAGDRDRSEPSDRDRAVAGRVLLDLLPGLTAAVRHVVCGARGVAVEVGVVEGVVDGHWIGQASAFLTAAAGRSAAASMNATVTHPSVRKLSSRGAVRVIGLAYIGSPNYGLLIAAVPRRPMTDGTLGLGR